MTNKIAIIVAAAIIGASIVAAQFVGRYQIAAGVGSDGSPFARKFNARTGEIQTCGVYSGDNQKQIRC